MNATVPARMHTRTKLRTRTRARCPTQKPDPPFPARPPARPPLSLPPARWAPLWCTRRPGRRRPWRRRGACRTRRRAAVSLSPPSVSSLSRPPLTLLPPPPPFLFLVVHARSCETSTKWAEPRAQIATRAHAPTSLLSPAPKAPPLPDRRPVACADPDGLTPSESGRPGASLRQVFITQLQQRAILLNDGFQARPPPPPSPPYPSL